MGALVRNLFLTLILTILVVGKSDCAAARIINGTNSFQMSPYGVEIVARKNLEGFVESRGGGTLISFTVVLTSANTVYGYTAVHVRLGSYLWNYLSSVNVLDYLVHPEYNAAAHLHDIALVRLAQSVENSKNCPRHSTKS